jgi:hypothetical protein
MPMASSVTPHQAQSTIGGVRSRHAVADHASVPAVLLPAQFFPRSVTARPRTR